MQAAGFGTSIDWDFTAEVDDFKRRAFQSLFPGRTQQCQGSSALKAKYDPNKFIDIICAIASIRMQTAVFTCLGAQVLPSMSWLAWMHSLHGLIRKCCTDLYVHAKDIEFPQA